MIGVDMAATTRKLFKDDYNKKPATGREEVCEAGEGGVLRWVDQGHLGFGSG